MRRKSALIIFVFLSLSCGQWRVTSLTPKLILAIPNGSKPGQVSVKTDDYALESLSACVGFSGGKILVSDNELKRFQILDKSGAVELIIGSDKNLDQKKFKVINFTFDNIGVFHIDKEGTLYIQNRLPRQNQAKGEDADFSPSYILAFSEKGKLEYTLGQTGSPDIPFYNIESIETDVNGRLMVVTRSFNSWNVYGFTGKKRDYNLNISKTEFAETEGKETYKGTIENVKTYHSGGALLVSVAYYQELRLKFRKLYEFSIPEGKISKTLMTMPDPRNVLFNLIEDKHVYFWNIENSETKFMICNIDGNILSNIRLSDKEKKSYYSKIFSDRAGHIYSFQISRGGIKLFEWE